MPKYKVTNNETGETKVIEADSEPDESTALKYFDKPVDAPSVPTNQSKGIWDTVKDYASKGYDKLTSSLAPDITLPYTTKAGDITDKNNPGFLTRAVSEIAQRGYDKIVKPNLSPLGLATTLGTLGESTLAKTVGGLGLGALSAKGLYDSAGDVKKAYNDPSVENVSDAALGVLPSALMGVGAVGKLSSNGGSSIKGGTEPINEPTVKSSEPPITLDDNDFKSEPLYGKLAVKPNDTNIPSSNDAIAPVTGVFENNKVSKYEPVDFNTNTNPHTGDFNEEFPQYVQNRQAATLEGDYAGKKFSYLDQDTNEPGLANTLDLDKNHPLVHLQEAMKEGEFPEVREHLDDLHQQLNQAGVTTDYKQDYLPQLWDNSVEQIKSALGKKMGLKPGFTFQSFYDDYKAGIEGGLTPKFDKPSELLDFYTSYAKKAIADKQFFDYLGDKNLISTDRSSIMGAKALNPDFFPKAWDVNGTKTYYTSPRIQKVIENYFKDPSQGSKGEQFLSDTGKLSSMATRQVLGFHLPGTAWSMHGANTAISHSLFGEDLNPLKAVGRLGEAAHYLTNPEKAGQFLETNPASAIKAVKDGGLSIGNWSSDIGKPLISGESFAAKGLNLLTDPSPLFGKVIPGLMLKAYERSVKSMTDNGVDYTTAARNAGKQINEQFGVLNRDSLMQDKTLTNLRKTVLLAPSWLEGQGKLGLGMGKALLDPNNPVGKKYLSGVTNFLASYTALNVMNALANNGKLMYQNEPGHELDVSLGQDNLDKTRYIKPYASNLAMIKVPLEIAHAAVKGDLSKLPSDTRSRLSEPVSFANDLISNTDWKGKALLGGKDKKGHKESVFDQVSNVMNDALSKVLPIGLEGIKDYSQGNISGEEAAARALQIPVGYRKPEATRKKSRYSGF